MRASHHVVISVAVSGVLLATRHSVALSAAVLIGGVLIDVDHVAEYLFIAKKPFSLRRFFATFYEGRLERVHIFLHSWELMFALLAAAILTGWNPLVAGLFIGMSCHLLLDQICNRPRPLGYFLAYRALKGFSYRLIFPHGGIHDR